MNYSNWRSRLQNSAYVTNAILAVTILVFLLETFSGGSTNNSVLVFYGARLNPLILYVQWWRLMTPVFVHIGLMHI
ncbi:MAG: rhomboid family intramembrane serine protease, partial [Lacticaseibacillus paracasei]